MMSRPLYTGNAQRPKPVRHSGWETPILDHDYDLLTVLALSAAVGGAVGCEGEQTEDNARRGVVKLPE